MSKKTARSIRPQRKIKLPDSRPLPEPANKQTEENADLYNLDDAESENVGQGQFGARGDPFTVRELSATLPRLSSGYSHNGPSRVENYSSTDYEGGRDSVNSNGDWDEYWYPCESEMSDFSQSTTSFMSWSDDIEVETTKKVQEMYDAAERFLYDEGPSRNLSSELLDECMQWKSKFKHLRVVGVGINPQKLSTAETIPSDEGDVGPNPRKHSTAETIPSDEEDVGPNPRKYSTAETIPSDEDDLDISPRKFSTANTIPSDEDTDGSSHGETTRAEEDEGEMTEDETEEAFECLSDDENTLGKSSSCDEDEKSESFVTYDDVTMASNLEVDQNVLREKVTLLVIDELFKYVWPRVEWAAAWKPSLDPPVDVTEIESYRPSSRSSMKRAAKGLPGRKPSLATRKGSNASRRVSYASDVSRKASNASRKTSNASSVPRKGSNASRKASNVSDVSRKESNASRKTSYASDFSRKASDATSSRKSSSAAETLRVPTVTFAQASMSDSDGDERPRLNRPRSNRSTGACHPPYRREVVPDFRATLTKPLEIRFDPSAVAAAAPVESRAYHSALDRQPAERPVDYRRLSSLSSRGGWKSAAMREEEYLSRLKEERERLLAASTGNNERKPTETSDYARKQVPFKANGAAAKKMSSGSSSSSVTLPPIGTVGNRGTERVKAAKVGQRKTATPAINGSRPVNPPGLTAAFELLGTGMTRLDLAKRVAEGSTADMRR